MKPEIYAKSALKVPDMECKVNIGCDGIEIQLLGELVNGHVGKYFSASEIFNLDMFGDFRVSVVHCPILSGIGDMTIEQLCDETDFKLLRETCRIANYFGRKQNEMVTVVVHSEVYLDFIRGIGSTFNRIRKYIVQLLAEFEYIRFGIENVSPLRGLGKGSSLHLANNFKFDNVELVNELRNVINSERVGTVLDTCHALLANKYMTVLYREIGDRVPEVYSMDAYFNANKDTCFLIHLADIAGSGYGKGRHGVPYTDATKDDCYAILDLYKKYGYTCPITLEVEETDFLVCDGYRSTKKVIDNYKW